jgi:hypothetical protein
MADPMQLEQVSALLVSNAIEFPRLDMPLRIHPGVWRLDGLFEFSVSDNGIGIQAEYRDRIFVIYQRLHTKDAYPGTGTGSLPSYGSSTVTAAESGSSRPRARARPSSSPSQLRHEVIDPSRGFFEKRRPMAR